VPITMSNLFTMLGDARDLALALPVVKDKRALLRTDAKDGVGVGPTNVRSLILV